MHYNVIVFGDNVRERMLPFYDEKYPDSDTMLCFRGAFYNSLTLLRKDYPQAKDSNIHFCSPNREWDGAEIGGRYSGTLKVFNDKDGYILDKSKNGYLDQTHIGNLDLSEQGFVPDAYLLKGKWINTPVRFWNEDEYNDQSLNATQWQIWKDLLLSLPKDTTVTLVDWHR